MRSVTKADLPSLAGFFQRTLANDSLSSALLEEKVYGDPGFDPDLNLVIVEDEVIASALAVARPDGKGYIKLIAVDPEHRRKGLATSLLTCLEERLANRGVVTIRPGESAPNYLQPGIDLRLKACLALFAKRGFCEIGETMNLSVDLNAQIWRTTSHVGGCTLKRAKEAHRHEVSSFLATHWPPWQQEVAIAFGNQPISLFLAFDGTTLTAFSAYDCNNRGTGWFGPMGTAPAYRGRGLGAALVHRCLHDLAHQGFEKATIPWVGPMDFYARTAGAVVDARFQRMEKIVSRQN